jgi:predicted transcriptional regulator
VRLREADALDDASLEDVRKRLARLDFLSRAGEWTRAVLRSIERHPRVPAARLSQHLGFDKMWLKTNIRKLKELGLTISHESGYELSPRGKVVLSHLEDTTPDAS